MWIKRITLVNVGCHDFFDVELQRGLIGIFGPNGAGKSTITDTAYAVLTNDWGRFAGVKTDNIRDTAEAHEKSWARLVAEHDGIEFTIERSLRPNRSSLQVTGEAQQITKAGEITDRLRELGVDDKLIGTYVFVPQWQMFDFISQTPGVRAESYQRLCRTERAQQICDAIDKVLTNDPHLHVAIVDNSDDIRLKIGDLQRQWEDCKARSAQLRPLVLSDSAVAELQQQIKRWERKQEALEKLVKLRQVVAEVDANFAVENATLEQQKQQQLRLVAEQAEYHAWLNAYELLNHKWQNYTRVQTARMRAESLLQESTEQLAKIRQLRPTVSPVVGDLEIARSNLAQMQAKCTRLQGIVSHFTSTGLAECETCGTPTAALDLKTKRTELQVVLDLHKQQAAAVAQLVSADRAMREWVATEQRQAAQLANRQQQLAEIEDVDKPVEELSDNRAAYQTQLANVVAQLHEVQIQIGQQLTLVGQMQGRREMAVRQSQELLVPAMDEVTAETVTSAQQRLDATFPAMAEWRQLQLEGKRLRGAMTECKQSLADLEQQLDKMARRRSFLNRLTQIKQVFHRQNLPRLVAMENLEDMEGGMNASLERFGDPFVVEATEDLSFNVYFPGAPARPADRISGGQKGVLALTFRTESGRLYASEMGMMVLDEPTAGMDTHNVTCLQEALQAYALELRGEQQVIMITHSEQLRPAFDQIIDL